MPADAAELARVTGLRFGSADPVAPGAEASAVARLEPGSPVALLPEGGVAAAVPEDPAAGPVPEVSRAEALGGTVVLATGGPESLAGIATARAAGARVLLTGGVTDPRASADLVAALSEGPAERSSRWGRPSPRSRGSTGRSGPRSQGANCPAGDSCSSPAGSWSRSTANPGRRRSACWGSRGWRRASSGPGTTPPRTSRWSTGWSSSPRSRSSRPSRPPDPARTGTTPTRPIPRCSGRGSRRRGRPACTSCWTCSPAAPTSAPRPSATARCWSCRTWAWPSTRSGGWGPTRCTCGRSAPSASTR